MSGNVVETRDLRDGRLVVTLNRPEAANALNTAMGQALAELFEGLATPGAVRCVVLTGAGSRAFCAGADLKERNGMTDAAWGAQHKVFEAMMGALIACPVPVIAAVNGAAFGGGCEIALACDFAYAATTARFALPETTLGLIPGLGGTQALPRAIGYARAKELVFTGRAFTAEDALAWGLVNRICAPEALLDEALETAARVASGGPLAVAQAKRAMAGGRHQSLGQAMETELEAYEHLVPSQDRREGVAAFNEKRKPSFTGR